MNSIELADHLAAEQGLTKAAAKLAIESVVTAIIAAAAKGDEITLSGFGKFKVASRAAREGRNPATGANIMIAASKKLSFTPAKALKDALNTAPEKKAAKVEKK
jgi:DNA-binding protein HU-beta